MGKFGNKVAIVTGASDGIGAATAVALAKEGAKLVINGRNKERLAETGKLCKAAGAEVLEVISDLDKFENLETLISKTIERFSQLDILVNNAGRALICATEFLAVEDYESLFRINVRAPVFLCKYALPHLKKTKGCVVNVSSVDAFIAERTNVFYAMTKAALDHFTRGFAAETAQFGVRVCSVNPALVDTNILGKVGLEPEHLEKIMRETAAGQIHGLISKEAVADAILFLCTSTHITGSTLLIDGGQLLPT